MAVTKRKTREVRLSADQVLRKTKKISRKDEAKNIKEATEGENNVENLKKYSQDKKWYVVNTQTGHEVSASKAMKQRIEATGLDDFIGEIIVPTQKKIVIKNGQQVVKEDRIFPGYLLINMVLNEKTWELIVNTDGVTGFVRTDKYPRPLPENEVKAIMKYMEIEQPAYQASFNVGDAVKITEGPFADFIGSVQKIDATKGKAEVLISFLGREAPVELDFTQIVRL